MSRSEESNPSVGLVLFAGPGGDSPVEAMVDGASHAALLDTLDQVRFSGAFDPIILVTDVPHLRAEAGLDVHLEEGGQDFHFGRRLLEIVRAYRLKAVTVASAGSGPLLRAEGLAAFAQALTPGSIVVANNLFSADILAFTPADTLERVTLPARDNSLPQVLWREGGLQALEIPRTVATLFDVDTPSDLVILALHPGTGPHLRAYLQRQELDTSTVWSVGRLLTDHEATVVVAGRVGSHAWGYLERETACRVRLFSEERGMEADGRDVRGEVRSLLGFYAQELGVRRLFAALAELGEAVILDTRVLQAHLGLHPSREDRFLLDLCSADGIQDAFLRELALEAQEATIPVLLGGHSLVSGGLMALTEAAWLEVDREKGISIE